MIVKQKEIISKILFEVQQRSFTLRNETTKNSFSFSISIIKGKRKVFLILKRTAKDDYVEIGEIKNNKFNAYYKSTLLPENDFIVWGIKSFEWYINSFIKNGINKKIDFRINEKCLKCGVELKNNVSLANGLGKECLSRFLFINKYKTKF